tara:strand:- start:6606 stop:7271 length:666 start_codon:yes stop_codon:yes gene_type:complete
MNTEIFKRFISSIILIPLCLFFIFKGSFFFVSFILVLFLLSIYEWYFLAKKRKYLVPGFLLLSLSFILAYFLRKNGLTEFMIIILICIFTDIGGYTFGKLFKGPKLTKISPNKTYSGLIGSLITSLLAFICLIMYSKWNSEQFEINLNFFELSYSIQNFTLVILISLVSQSGDIIISYFKRLAKVKNTGNLIPGHGGILDRIDGMIFVFPSVFIIYFILNL